MGKSINFASKAAGKKNNFLNSSSKTAKASARCAFTSTGLCLSFRPHVKDSRHSVRSPPDWKKKVKYGGVRPDITWKPGRRRETLADDCVAELRRCEAKC